ncbi:Zinc finger C2H2-type protein [Macrophomina phaseolina MS6]|uniref:Zinc finger C2H2-type protein n=2 Tax=Macrophomina phaseolina TaxID=35725 RepID=K2QMP4_MACPH|nr:Zinc finger C2H2-type protein [Macrophomina phaseolina MS6]
MDAKKHWSYPYECGVCNLAFRFEDDRDEHREDEGHFKERYCEDCDRVFQNENCLRQHLNSRTHRGATVECPFCGTCFTTASGVSHHLESSACPKARNLDRASIHRAIRQRDPNGVITERLLEWHENDRRTQWDPESAWTGRGYQCYLCSKLFNKARSLRQHIDSPAHQAPLYHCPNKNGRCGGKQFPTLAALFNHLESESCGFVKFNSVQNNVQGFLTGGRQKLVAF